MTRLSDRIREQLAATMAPCPTCGHARDTIAGVAEKLKQPPSTVGKFIAGGKPTVGLLDAAEEYLEGPGAVVYYTESPELVGEG
jgi:hypothetical protein